MQGRDELGELGMAGMRDGAETLLGQGGKGMNWGVPGCGIRDIRCRGELSIEYVQQSMTL